MTYKEIKTRLTKCELALKRVEQEKSSSNSIELKRSLEEKIGMLKENLTKQLKQNNVSDEHIYDEEFAFR